MNSGSRPFKDQRSPVKGKDESQSPPLFYLSRGKLEKRLLLWYANVTEYVKMGKRVEW